MSAVRPRGLSLALLFFVFSILVSQSATAQGRKALIGDGPVIDDSDVPVSPGSNVPRLVKLTGQLPARSVNPAVNPSGTRLVTFSLYTRQEGGSPIWNETQVVNIDVLGNYSVMLGSTVLDGIPVDAFSSGQARWLGITIEGEPEQPRMLLVSVPYALKAAEAETLDGKSASDFVSKSDLQTAVQQSLAQVLSAASTSTATSTAQPSGGLDDSLHGNNSLANVQPSITQQGVTGAGATSFTDTSGNEVVFVSQQGTGTAINATAGNTGTVAVNATAGSQTGIAVYGSASSTSGTAVGVRGDSAAASGQGVLGSATSTTGAGVGVQGQSSGATGSGVSGTATGASGVGVLGTASSPTGSTIAIQGVALSPNGIAGVFNVVQAGATILSGQFNGNPVFTVDSQGNVRAKAYLDQNGNQVMGLPGPQGPAGLQGPIGLTGPQGPAGSQGTAGANGAFSLNGTSAVYTGGSVGIGTATPNAVLEVRDANGSPTSLRITNGTTQQNLGWDFGFNGNGNMVAQSIFDKWNFYLDTDNSAPTGVDFNIYQGAPPTGTPSLLFNVSAAPNPSGTGTVGNADVTGNLTVAGTVNAAHFVGDGSGLTGVGIAALIVNSPTAPVSVSQGGSGAGVSTTSTGSGPAIQAQATGTGAAGVFESNGTILQALNGTGTEVFRVDQGGVAIGQGQRISDHLSVNAMLQIPQQLPVNANNPGGNSSNCLDFPVSVPNAAVRDTVAIGPGAGVATLPGVQITGFVSAPGIVTIRGCSQGNLDVQPPSQFQVRVDVWKHSDSPDGSITGNILQIAPQNITFSPTPIETSSSPVFITLTNVGSGGSPIAGLTIGQPTNAEFILQNVNCPASIPTNTSCVLSATYSPTQQGLKTATVTLTYVVGDSSPSTQTINLAGNTISVAGGSPLRLNPSQIFLSSVVGIPSPPQTLTVSNVSNAAVTFAITGPSAPFSIASNTCTGSLAAAPGPGSSCTLQIILTPTVANEGTGAGVFSSFVTVIDSSNISQSVSLFGLGENPLQVTPNVLNFGSIAAGTSVTNTLTVTNQGTNQITVTTGNSGPFSIVSGGTCQGTTSFPLAPHSSCTLNFAFNPLDGTTSQIGLLISDNLNDSVFAELNGTGVAGAAILGANAVSSTTTFAPPAVFAFTTPLPILNSIHDSNNSTTTPSAAVVIKEDSQAGLGLYAETTSPTSYSVAPGGSVAVSGVADDPLGIGVFGYAASTTGGTGVLGQSGSASGLGILGRSTATTGSTGVGVRGVSAGDAGVGVVGRATSLTGNTFGVRGRSDSNAGVGVQAFSNNVGLLAQSQDCSAQQTNPTAPCVPSPHEAGQFVTGAGGIIVHGFSADANNNWTQKFLVDSNGNVQANSYNDLNGNPIIASLGSSAMPLNNSFFGNETFNSNNAANAVSVVETGTGAGVSVSTTTSSAIFASSTSPSTPALFVTSSSSPAGFFEGNSTSPTIQVIEDGPGTAVQGTTGSANGFGVFGVNNTPGGGVGVQGNATGTTGFATGVQGQSSSSQGVGVQGVNVSNNGGWGVKGIGNNTGTVGVEGFSPTVGVRGQSLSCSGQTCTGQQGDGGQFLAGAGGNLLHGFLLDTTGNFVEKFKVDSSGNVSASGQLISNVPTGTAPMVVASTTPVRNLTAAPTTYYYTDFSGTGNGSAVQVPAPHIVTGEQFQANGTTVTVTLPANAAFTSITSYVCTATPNSINTVNGAPLTFDVRNVDGSHFVIDYSAFADTVINFICVGN